MSNRLSRLWTYLFVNTPRPGGVRVCLWGRFKDGIAEMGWIALAFLPLVAMVALCILCFRTGADVAGNRYQEQAIEHGAAQYNPQTAEFEWKADGNECNSR